MSRHSPLAIPGASRNAAAVVAPDVGPDPSVPDPATMQAAVRRLLTRMRVDGLWLRRDPTDPDSAILVRPGGATTSSSASAASLGAGRVRWAVVAAALEAGLLREGPGRRIAAVDAGPADRLPDPGQTGPSTDARRENPGAGAAESPLAWLHRRRGADGEPLIDAAAFAAGERLRSDATLAALLPSVTQNWARADGPASTAGFDPAGASDAMVAARQRVRAVYRVLGARTGDFLIDVCAFHVPLQEAERRRGWPARSGKLVLQLALGQLAAHYGIELAARGPDRSRRLRVWQAEDPPGSITQIVARLPDRPQDCDAHRS